MLYDRLISPEINEASYGEPADASRNTPEEGLNTGRFAVQLPHNRSYANFSLA